MYMYEFFEHNSLLTPPSKEHNCQSYASYFNYNQPSSLTKDLSSLFCEGIHKFTKDPVPSESRSQGDINTVQLLLTLKKMFKLTATGSTAAMSEANVNVCINFRSTSIFPDTPNSDRPVCK